MLTHCSINYAKQCLNNHITNLVDKKVSQSAADFERALGHFSSSVSKWLLHKNYATFSSRNVISFSCFVGLQLEWTWVVTNVWILSQPSAVIIAVIDWLDFRHTCDVHPLHCALSDQLFFCSESYTHSLVFVFRPYQLIVSLQLFDWQWCCQLQSYVRTLSLSSLSLGGAAVRGLARRARRLNAFVSTESIRGSSVGANKRTWGQRKEFLGLDELDYTRI
jgi:hypothetical protein